MVTLTIWFIFFFIAISLWFPFKDRPVTYAVIASLLICPNVASYPGIIPGFFVVLPLLACLPGHIIIFPEGLLFTAMGIPAWFVTCAFVSLIVQSIQKRNSSHGKPDDA